MTPDAETIRAAVRDADRETLTGVILAVLRVTEGWEEKALAEFGDTSLSASAQKAYQVWEAMEAVLGGGESSD